MLSDNGIKALIEFGHIQNAKPESIQTVVYDLETLGFVSSREEFEQTNGYKDSIVLNPGESVFVASNEIVSLPNDITMQVHLRNSRIRQGLSLDAPLYFPGHKTRVFFRVTNVSAEKIRLDKNKGIASVSFEKTDDAVERPYKGAFTDEFDFSGMASYTGYYSPDIDMVEEKIDNVKGIERNIYGNVMTLMSIFVCIFTLVNVNLTATYAAVEPKLLVVLNLVTVGSFAALAGLITIIVQPKSIYSRCIPWIASIVLFIAAIAVYTVI